jgi:protein TonB
VTGGTATVLSRIDPVLPEAARRARVRGPVILEVLIDVTGQVGGVRVLRGDPLLNQLASDAVRQWRFEPVTFHGKLTPIFQTVVVSFKDR